MPIDPETLYRQLGELLIAVPDFYKPGPLAQDGHQWLARAYALVKAGDDIDDTMRMKSLTKVSISSSNGNRPWRRY